MAKTLRDHITESESWVNSPAVGDDFAINIREECLVESHIVDVVEDGIVIQADDRMMAILESYGLLDDGKNPISNRQERELIKKGIFPSGAEAEHYRRQMGRAGKISTRQMKSLEKGKRPGGPNEREYANRMHADDPAPMEGAADPVPVTKGHFADKPGQKKPYPELWNPKTGKVRPHPADKNALEGSDPYRREISPPSPEEFEEGVAEQRFGNMESPERTKIVRSVIRDLGLNSQPVDHIWTNKLRDGSRTVKFLYRGDAKQATSLLAKTLSKKGLAQGQDFVVRLGMPTTPPVLGYTSIIVHLPVQSTGVAEAAAPTEKAGNIIKRVLGNQLTWEPGVSKMYKNTRRSKTQRVDDYVMKNIRVNAKIPHYLSADVGDALAVALKNELVKSGYPVHSDVMIFPDEVMFQTRTPITVTAEQGVAEGTQRQISKMVSVRESDTMRRMRELAGIPLAEGAIKRSIDNLYYDFRDTHDLAPDVDDDTYLAAVAKFLDQQGVDRDYSEDIGELFLDMRDREQDNADDFNQTYDDDQEDLTRQPGPGMEDDEQVDEGDYDESELYNGAYVRDEQDGPRGEVFRMTGDPSERRVRIDDRNGRGWYISPSRLTPVDEDDPAIAQWFGSDDDEEDEDAMEAKYQGREVPLGKPMAGDVKKSKVYVKGPKGNVVKVNFGDKTMRIKKSNPKRRKNFRARHNCANPGPRWKARYWSCRAW